LELARNDATPAPAVISKAAPAILTLKNKHFGRHFHQQNQEISIFFKKISLFVVKRCFS